MTRAAPRRRAPGPVLFASAAGEARARRPTDVALAITSLLVLVVVAVLGRVGADLDAGLVAVLEDFPPFLDPLWKLLAWAPIAWAVVLLVAAVARRRLPLARDIAAGVVVAIAISAVLGAAVDGDPWVAVARFFDFDEPPAFPPGAIALTAAAIAIASPHLSRPVRHLGRWLVLGQLVGMIMLSATSAAGCVAAVMVGLLAAALVHLVVGSPGGRPTSSRIELALHELGVDVADLAAAPGHDAGVVRFTGHDVDGPIGVKVYGRDAWDAQLLTTLWRLTWYRGGQRTARLTRVELVEHEGFVTLLAERSGVRVPRLVTAGSAGQGDALVVVRQEGRPLEGRGRGASVGAATDAALTDDALDSLWRQLGRLHDAGIAHHRIDLDRVVRHDDGTLGFGDLSSAGVAETPADRQQDEAQAFALLLAVAGEERAVASARRGLGDDGLLQALRYLQEAALTNGVRDALSVADLDVDKIRNRVRVVLGADEQQLIRLRRVTAGSLLNLALLVVAAYALIAAFGGMDLQSFLDALRDASWWWLAFALVVAQVARVAAAISTTGSVATPLPLGPLTALQFAICYVNLAIPSTAARVAINVRFLQRFGVPPATAMTAGVIDSVSGFVVQIVLFVAVFFTSDLDLGLSTDAATTSGAGTIALIVIAVLVVAAAVVALVRPVRRWVLSALHQAADALRVLRAPSKLVRLFGGNLLTQILFAIAFAVSAEAFGVHLPMSQFILINTVVSLFAGLIPVPGGIGVTEAGLTFGLTAAGVPSETAFAVALAYRFTSFYLPPIWGWFCYRWLVRRHYL
jgi:glycosyltransferase 2 family protein